MCEWRKLDSSATSFAFHGFFLKSSVVWLEPRMRSAFARDLMKRTWHGTRQRLSNIANKQGIGQLFEALRERVRDPK
jgi:hypothetical protein